MDLKQIKRVTAFARKSGIKSLKSGDFEVVFHDAAILPTPTRNKAALTQVADTDKPAPLPEPTLDQINAYIYQDSEAG